MERKEWTPLAAAVGIGAGLVFAGAAVARGMSTMAGLRDDRDARGRAGKADTTTFKVPDESSVEGAEHVPTDLMGDEHPDGSARAPEAFRPDPTAPIPESERDAFRPALGAATLVKGEADDIPRRSAEASSDGMGTIGGIGAVGGAGAATSVEPEGTAEPEAPKVG